MARDDHQRMSRLIPQENTVSLTGGQVDKNTLVKLVTLQEGGVSTKEMAYISLQSMNTNGSRQTAEVLVILGELMRLTKLHNTSLE